jgi:peptidoglycan/LPS O-acetylase OafA/YrhL
MATTRQALESPELFVPNDDSTGTPPDPRDRLSRNLNRSKIPGLDGIRAVSALTVAAAHADREFLPAGFAVVMFFILSGLLITWLLVREGDRCGSVNLRAFYIRRAFRLLPPLASLIVFTAIFKLPPASTTGLVTAALYCVNYFVAFGGHPFGIGHTWSLAIEEHFYLIWPAVFRRCRERGLLLKGLVAVAIVSALARLALAYGFSQVYAHNATETNATAIAVGCALAVCIRRSPRRLPRFLFHQWLVAPCLIAVAALAQIPKATPAPWATPAVVPLLAIILIQSIAFEWRVLENPAAYFLGRISYSIYLWHLVAIQVAASLLKASPAVLRPALPFYVLISVLLATASHYLIERPAQALGRRLAGAGGQDVGTGMAQPAATC